MVFDKSQRHLTYPALQVDNAMIKCEDELNYLGLILDTHIS